ncbi:hypothetical protein ANCDUO_16057 [Ancylostoma duodenale]|uniref:Uncharacterized protein n=1 Tax=Ancylostoma duodenale TaxID=51022 RepID=A0A0C2CVB9_9BILA|nr:hypothetical protein ANCDUO_16057 [Ancylostoma duodenale]
MKNVLIAVEDPGVGVIFRTRNTSTHKIMIIGNSYAANQGRIIYEMCNGPNVEMKIFTMPGNSKLLD